MNKQNRTPTPSINVVPMINNIESLALVDFCPTVSGMRRKLESQGFLISFEVNQSDSWLKSIQPQQPDVLVLVVERLERGILTELAQLYRRNPLAVLVFAQSHAPEALKTAVASGVCSYVVDDVRADRLPVIIDLAVERFEQSRHINSELEITKQKLNNRKLIEKAKGILMQKKQVSEEIAYAQMRRSAMNQGITIAELSKRITQLF